MLLVFNQMFVPCCGLSAFEPISLSQQNPRGKGPSGPWLSPSVSLVENQRNQTGKAHSPAGIDNSLWEGEEGVKEGLAHTKSKYLRHECKRKE